MKKFLDHIFSLDIERSIWVEEEDLGKEIAFEHKNKRYVVKIPRKIDKKITLRLRGIGKKRFNKTGDLFLQVWLNKGEDVSYCLWLSQASAKSGGGKRINVNGQVKTLVIPPNSHDGLHIRLKGYGREGRFDPRAPALSAKKKGNALVKLCVFPDRITPNYGSFEMLSTENMALEGWVYRKFDEVIKKVDQSFFNVNPLTAEAVADLLNEKGLRGIFLRLVDHMNLSNLHIALEQSHSIPQPGICEGTAIIQNNTPIEYIYKITINTKFLSNPFSIAAILAHELCHVVYTEKIDRTPKTAGLLLKSEQATLEEERTVDLLVFMYKIGEFQLRVARDERLTLGYFNQDIFDRIQVIVSRKMNLS